MEPAPTALHGLNRDPSHADIRLRKAAKDLETSFLAEMLKSAKILKMPDGFSGGAGEAHFQSYLVQGLAEALSTQRRFGLAALTWPVIKN
jgi:Rod binding domain-containing protein